MRFLLLGVLAGVFIRCSPDPKIQTDLKDYPALYEAWSRQEMADPFPKTVPAEATSAKVASMSSRYANFFQLRLTLPEAEVRKVTEEAARQAKASIDGGRAPSLEATPQDGWPDAIFHTADAPAATGLTPFPTDYRIHLYDAQPLPPAEEGKPWLHGRNNGVAISQKRHEVIYFSQRW